MLLPNYCYNLVCCNIEIVTHIEMDEQPQFIYFFMALGCSILAFQQHIRLVPYIDATFLKVDT